MVTIRCYKVNQDDVDQKAGHNAKRCVASGELFTLVETTIDMKDFSFHASDFYRMIQSKSSSSFWQDSGFPDTLAMFPENNPTTGRTKQ